MRDLAATPLIRRLLAALLLLQVVLAPALCLPRPAAADDLVVEICTADGLRQRHLAAGDAASPEDIAPGDDSGTGGHAFHAGVCVACHALPQAAMPPVPVLPSPSWAVAPLAWSVAGSIGLPPAIRGPPSGPRAPPSRLS